MTWSSQGATMVAAWWAVGLVVLAGACGPGKGDGASEGATTGMGSSGDGATLTSAGQSTSTGATSVQPTTTASANCAGNDTGSSTGSTSMPVPDAGPGGITCSQWLQDCPPGEKCMPYSGDGDNSWESLKCVPVVENPGQVGDPCTAESWGLSGIDSCDVGHMCWDIDPQTGEGECVAFCTGTEDQPMCEPDHWCTIPGAGVLTLCLPRCSPLLGECESCEVCIQVLYDFTCVLDASGGEGQEFDPCEYANACDPGLYCHDPSAASECDPMAIGCCLAFCDLDNPSCKGEGAECLPWYEMEMAPPGLENLGGCVLPL